MDSGGERKEKRGGDRRTSFRGEYEEVGVGWGRGYQQLQRVSERASEGGRSPKSSRADYAGMTSHFSLREYIEWEGAAEGCTFKSA